MSRYNNMDGSAGRIPDEHLKRLVQQSQEGQREAFGQIYDLLAEPLYKFIYVRIQHRETAEDLLSLTFLKAWQHLPRYRIQPQAKFTTWLFQICKHVVHDHWRKSGREVTLEDYHLPIQVGASPSLTEQVDLALSSAYLLRALRQLPKRYREVLTLRFINQLSFDEVANIMKVSNGAARVLQTRALKVLKKFLS